MGPDLCSQVLFLRPKALRKFASLITSLSIALISGSVLDAGESNTIVQWLVLLTGMLLGRFSQPRRRVC